ncbi:MAG: serine hydrolase [SAR86 cluster bacterium]|nr:serine hydrolase [SAR86 cluster bacterium]
MEIKGNCQERFLEVKELFGSLHKSGREVGSSFSVYQDGKPIIDIWGGYSDKDQTKQWNRDTLATVWSTTKGVAAITIAHAFENKLIEYERKVSEYWPEFGCNGKEDITVGMLLSHQAGICGSKTDNVEDYYSQSVMAKELANMHPIWEPGTASGYHSMTYGWLVSELIIRVTGKTLGNYFKENIGDPNQIDFHIGLPLAEEKRVAEMIPFPKESNQSSTKPNDAQIASGSGPNLLKHQNTTKWRSAEIPSANGQGCASAIAKLYSLVVTDDHSLKIINDKTIETMTAERITNRDLVLDVVTRWGSGFIMNMHKVIYGPEETSFGHSGWGGSCGFGDPINRIGVSYVMNNMKNNFAADGRSLELINKTYECLKGDE